MEVLDFSKALLQKKPVPKIPKDIELTDWSYTLIIIILSPRTNLYYEKYFGSLPGFHLMLQPAEGF